MKDVSTSLIFKPTQGTIPQEIITHLEEFRYARVILIINDAYFLAQPVVITGWGNDTRKYRSWEINGEFVPPSSVNAYAILPSAIEVLGGL
ncbi:MAG: hypothetical protein JRE40_00270 [Deltaproteobacteria bacterium]|nr:hypothetical protein [Deltaproteobacteria bacterium]